MNFDYDLYTNSKGWYQDCKLEGTNCILWHTFHIKQWSLEELKQLPKWDTADKIFLIGQEADILDYNKDDSRIYLWDNLIIPNKERYHYYFWWWRQVQEVEYYKKFIEKLCNPLDHEPAYYFDCLMASGDKPHRIFVSNQIKKYKLQNKILGGNNKYIQGFEGKINDSPDSEYVTTDLMGRVPYNESQTVNISNFIPYLVYNQSWFSILTETRIHINFFTEKTAKVLYARRLFVYFGAQHALKDLQYLGYKTFSGVVDESYDNEPNDLKRWSMAWDQVRYLCRQDPEVIYKKVKDTLDHNQKLFMQQDFDKIAKDQIQKIVFC